MDETTDPLEEARRHLGMSVAELWWRYFALGGSSTELEMEAILFQALVPANTDRDTLAVALNERFSELGADHPIPYSDDDP
jgi:hypothetical protein